MQNFQVEGTIAISMPALIASLTASFSLVAILSR